MFFCLYTHTRVIGLGIPIVHLIRRWTRLAFASENNLFRKYQTTAKQSVWPRYFRYNNWTEFVIIKITRRSREILTRRKIVNLTVMDRNTRGCVVYAFAPVRYSVRSETGALDYIIQDKCWSYIPVYYRWHSHEYTSYNYTRRESIECRTTFVQVGWKPSREWVTM